ncbi:MAG: hypothetical protein DMG22_21550 [Acidobacteria bacterium]|nr:MAG: hypothetical protein DMG22_21550 [Acidobacteriota bacterium]
MKTQNQGMQFSLACLLLILGAAWGSPAWPAPPSNKPGGGPPDRAGSAQAPAGDTTASSTTTTSGTSTATSGVMYSGQAFGAFVNVNLLGLVVGPETLSDTGPLPPSGGLQTNQLETVSIPGVLSATLMSTMTSGANGVARSEASLADLSVLPGSAAAVTASFVRAESEATCSGVRGATEVADVTFGGQAIMVDPFAPNQTFTIPPNPIGVPPVATLIINEQNTSSGGGTQDITVNALHLTVTASGVLAAEVILSSAHSDVQGCPGCPPKPPCSTDFVTGGGWIKVGNSKANFGFNAGFKPNASTPEIHFNYIDHNSGMQMKATSISVYRQGDTATTRHMEGNAEINGVPGFTYSIDVADNGEPGRHTDTFAIELNGANFHYSAGSGETLEGGNIQLHKPCP